MDFTTLSYSAYRTFNGNKFRLRVAWYDDELHVSAYEKREEVGDLSGQYCMSLQDLMSADSVDCRGPETFTKIEKLHNDITYMPFLYLGGLHGEGKGRNIGILLLQEVARALLRMDYEETPVVCWYAYPEEPIAYTQENIGRLIRFYRRVGAINPCLDRQVMLWDPGAALEFVDIRLQDKGPDRTGQNPVQLDEKSRISLRLIAMDDPAAFKEVDAQTYASLVRKGLVRKRTLTKKGRRLLEAQPY